MNAFDNVNKKIDAGVLNAMTKAGEDICQKMRDKLIEGGHFQTGELIDSITSEVVENEGSVSVQVNMLNYGKFIDSGTGAAHGAEGRGLHPVLVAKVTGHIGTGTETGTEQTEWRQTRSSTSL